MLVLVLVRVLVLVLGLLGSRLSSEWRIAHVDRMSVDTSNATPMTHRLIPIVGSEFRLHKRSAKEPLREEI